MNVIIGDTVIDCGTDIFSAEAYDLAELHLFLSREHLAAIAHAIGLALAEHELQLCEAHRRDFAHGYAARLTQAFHEKRQFNILMDTYEEWSRIAEAAALRGTHEV